MRPKPDGSKRQLGIPAVLDRIIQQAIAQVMGLIFDPLFSESSCGFRPGRSAHDGVRQVKQFIGQGYSVAVDTDLSKFFDKVNHDVLMVRVSRRIKDKRMLRLIGKYLSAGTRVMASIRRFLDRELRLKVNEKKSKVAPVGECGFLGFVFVRGKIRWSDKFFLEFKRHLRLFTGRSWFVSMEYRYKKLAEYVRGWINYYGISEYFSPIPGLDERLRRRIQCYWKQWRYTRTKVRNLLKLGIFKRQAIYTALRRRGPWHLSRTMATQIGMTNQWLSEQGLISVKEQWVKIHYPATAR